MTADMTKTRQRQRKKQRQEAELRAGIDRAAERMKRMWERKMPSMTSSIPSFFNPR